MAPLFLTLDEVLLIHQDQIENYGGTFGIRDLGLLESALAQPAATFDGEYLCEDLPAVAASYLFHIAKNHPFLDGNKRVGAVAAIVFLDLNGMDLECTNEELERTVASVADGSLTKGALAAFIREHTISSQ